MASSNVLVDLQDAAALWSIGSVPVAEVVDVACLCLVAGMDTPVLRILAGVSPTDTDQELLRWLEPAFDELGLIFHPKGSRAGQEAAVRAMARRVLADAVTPRELARWAHSTIGHDALPLAENLVQLDDVYDCLDYNDRIEAEVDAEVIAEATRVVRSGRSVGSPL